MDNSQRTKPWEDENGATNVDGFLKAFAEDSNTFWRMESGHALNIIEELIERHSLALQEVEKWKNCVHFEYPDGKDNADYRKENQRLLQSIEVKDEIINYCILSSSGVRFTLKEIADTWKSLQLDTLKLEHIGTGNEKTISKDEEKVTAEPQESDMRKLSSLENLTALGLELGQSFLRLSTGARLLNRTDASDARSSLTEDLFTDTIRIIQSLMRFNGYVQHVMDIYTESGNKSLKATSKEKL